MKLTNKFIITLLFLSNISYADQDVRSIKVNDEPIIDGIGNDIVWTKADKVVTYDPVAKIKIYLKTVYTKDKVFFLVKYKQNKPNKSHKNLIWDKKKQLYKINSKREDTFVFKWNMEPFSVDLTLNSLDNYRTDIWY